VATTASSTSPIELPLRRGPCNFKPRPGDSSDRLDMVVLLAPSMPREIYNASIAGRYFPARGAVGRTESSWLATHLRHLLPARGRQSVTRRLQ
jgi:hypothetical protein